MPQSQWLTACTTALLNSLDHLDVLTEPRYTLSPRDLGDSAGFEHVQAVRANALVEPGLTEPHVVSGQVSQLDPRDGCYHRTTVNYPIDDVSARLVVQHVAGRVRNSGDARAFESSADRRMTDYRTVLAWIVPAQVEPLWNRLKLRLDRELALLQDLHDSRPLDSGRSSVTTFRVDLARVVSTIASLSAERGTIEQVVDAIVLVRGLMRRLPTLPGPPPFKYGESPDRHSGARRRKAQEVLKRVSAGHSNWLAGRGGISEARSLGAGEGRGRGGAVARGMTDRRRAMYDI